MKKLITFCVVAVFMLVSSISDSSKIYLQETPPVTIEVSPTLEPTETATEILTDTPTPEPTSTEEPTNTQTEVPTRTPTEIPTVTPTHTEKPPKITDTPTPTRDFYYTKTPTITRQPTATPITPTATITRFPTSTSTKTLTPTSRVPTSFPTTTPRPTRYPTYTPYPTQTDLPTYTPNPTYTPKPTYTPIVLIIVAPTEIPITTEGVTITNEGVTIEKNVTQPVKIELPISFKIINYLGFALTFMGTYFMSTFLFERKNRNRIWGNIYVLIFLLNSMIYYTAWFLNEWGFLTIEYSDIFFMKWRMLLLFHILLSGTIMAWYACWRSGGCGYGK